MSRGIVFLASRTGNPIVPTAFVCSNAWKIQGSWTSQIIPKPFSRVVLLAGEPIHVPPDIQPQQIEAYRLQVQQAMNGLDEQATSLIAREEPDSSTSLSTTTSAAA
jgi:lysophospholipid acyltransferase (LPLAT)-like uncharacterized protein